MPKNIKTYAIISGIAIVLMCAVYAIGYYNGMQHDPVIQQVEVEKIVFKPVAVDVNTLDCDTAKERLNCYYSFPPIIDYKVTELSRSYTALTIHTIHCESDWSHDIKVPVHQEGSFRFYIGLGIGVAATAGAIYGGYKLVELMKK